MTYRDQSPEQDMGHIDFAIIVVLGLCFALLFFEGLTL